MKTSYSDNVTQSYKSPVYTTRAAANRKNKKVNKAGGGEASEVPLAVPLAAGHNTIHNVDVEKVQKTTKSNLSQKTNKSNLSCNVEVEKEVTNNNNPNPTPTEVVRHGFPYWKPNYYIVPTSDIETLLDFYNHKAKLNDPEDLELVANHRQLYKNFMTKLFCITTISFTKGLFYIIGMNFDATDVVPLAFKTNSAGTYEITLHAFDGLFANDQNVYVRDNVTGAEHNLKDGSYSFTTATGVFNERFELIYQSTLSVENPVLSSNVVVYTQEKNMHVAVQNTTISEVKIFDMRGRLVKSFDFGQLPAGQHTETLNMEALNSGLYFVEFRSGNTVATQKLIVNR